MALLPITDENGTVIDEYDDGRGEEQASEPSAPPSSVAQASSTVASHVPAAPPPVQAHVAPATPAGSAEDPTSFEASDVFIGITLHRQDGHPQGRLVSVCIHNFSGIPVVKTFREADLSTKARLDNMQKAIQTTMQPFFLDLSNRRQKKLEQEAKRAQATTRQIPPARPAQPPSSSTQTSQKSAPPTSSAAAAQPAAKTAEKKKPERPASKYQQISMF